MENALESAKNYATGAGAPLSAAELRDLVRRLKDDLEFGLARKVLSKARVEGFTDVWFSQQLALCTYKDEELVALTRFRDALRILDEARECKGALEDLAGYSETLALKGAVYKRLWEYRGQLEDLYRALTCYSAAWDAAIQPGPGATEPPIPPRDRGYSAVNAAFILDILNFRARRAAGRDLKEQPQWFREFDQDARRLREDALNRLNQALVQDENLSRDEWLPQTMAELHFGLHNYEEAGHWLAKAREIYIAETEKKEWEKQTTFKQLVSIARNQGLSVPGPEASPQQWAAPWQALAQFLGVGPTARALFCYRGKVGLALSGGGFRASLCHLGVLARLAEMDVLRGVEVLSTVSGGSIVGAHYYLEIQDLLQSKKDEDITREDYIGIVRRVQERFLAGVQQNLRMHALADFRKNLAMIFSKEYSRSHRLGELYEEAFYSLVGVDGNKRTAPHTMQELLITPADVPQGCQFNPKFSNWRREARVPVLLLNATSLNSGHNWHFTASWMGEPPGRLETEIDINERYRRLYYRQASREAHQNYPLGHAVAASACVPGLFAPLALEGLYPGRTVRLVDGGVNDNQGVESLLDEGCTLILCSDACGQMKDLQRPSDSIVGVPRRSNSILMDRVREAEYQDLRAGVESQALQGLFFIHLKKDLATLPIDWINCDDPSAPPDQFTCTTSYGMDRDLQRKLAAIRTDLDAFTEVEAYSLMLSGYLMTEHEFRELNRQHQQKNELDSTWGGYAIAAPRGDWPFLQLENLVRQPPDSSDARRTDLGNQLQAASSLVFKIFKLNPMLKGLAWCSAGLVILLVSWLCYRYWSATLFAISISPGLLIVSLVVLLAGVWAPLSKWLQPEKAMRGYVNKALVATIGYLLARLHLRFFNRLFVERGKLKRLLELR
jgi:predicted acylesterase/phospholipase RssA/tetratricopeptide (TPR) repeat protein